MYTSETNKKWTSEKPVIYCMSKHYNNCKERTVYTEK
jgi:hypothetical protein